MTPIDAALAVALAWAVGAGLVLTALALRDTWERRRFDREVRQVWQERAEWNARHHPSDPPPA